MRTYGVVFSAFMLGFVYAPALPLLLTMTPALIASVVLLGVGLAFLSYHLDSRAGRDQ